MNRTQQLTTFIEQRNSLLELHKMNSNPANKNTAMEIEKLNGIIKKLLEQIELSFTKIAEPIETPPKTDKPRYF